MSDQDQDQTLHLTTILTWPTDPFCNLSTISFLYQHQISSFQTK